jgi:hypothetical protein
VGELVAEYGTALRAGERSPEGMRGEDSVGRRDEGDQRAKRLRDAEVDALGKSQAVGCMATPGAGELSLPFGLPRCVVGSGAGRERNDDAGVARRSEERKHEGAGEPGAEGGGWCEL